MLIRFRWIASMQLVITLGFVAGCSWVTKLFKIASRRQLRGFHDHGGEVSERSHVAVVPQLPDCGELQS